MSHWAISVEEFTERSTPKTLWPFSTAFTLSLAAHGLLFVAALSWLESDITPPETSVNPVFDITLSKANSDTDSGSSSEAIVDNLHQIEEELSAVSMEAPAEENLVYDQPKTISPPAPEQLVSVSEQLLETSEQLFEPESAAIVEEEIVHTQSESWHVALSAPETPIEKPFNKPTTPELETQPVTDRQREMFQQQQQHWEEILSELENSDTEVTWQQGQQQFAASIRQQKPENNTDLERAIVEVSTEIDGVKMTTQFGYKRLAFSHYAQLVDRWDRDVVLSEDEINGRFHSNTRLNVADNRQEPIFNGKVTVASTISLTNFQRRSNIFLGGLETRVKKINLPKQLTSADTNQNELHSTGYQFDQDGQLVFLETGGFNWTSDNDRRFYPCENPCVISGGDGVTLSVEGLIKGTVLIQAKERIRITGSLNYVQDVDKLIPSLENFIAFATSDPEESAIEEPQDFLGLLSENYIEIAPPKITGPGDLSIHGALYAKRRFLVRNFRNRNKGLLSIFGSLTAGTISASEPRYATRIDFDPRFEQQRLPGFPMTNKFELENWDQQWVVEEPSEPELIGEKMYAEKVDSENFSTE